MKLARNLHHRYNFDAYADLHDVIRGLYYNPNSHFS